MPRAETDEDRKNQTEIADCVLKANASRYDGYIWLSEMNYRIDACFYKLEIERRPKAFAEIKQRNVPFGHFSDYQISVGKLIAANWLRQATGCPVTLIARFIDGVVAVARLDHHPDGFIVSGREDRDPLRYPHDIEPMACLGWDRFKVVYDPRGA